MNDTTVMGHYIKWDMQKRKLVCCSLLPKIYLALIYQCPQIPNACFSVLPVLDLGDTRYQPATRAAFQNHINCAWTSNNGQGYCRFLPLATSAATDDADATHRHQASLISSDCISDNQKEHICLQQYRGKRLSAFNIPWRSSGRHSFAVDSANRWPTAAVV